MQRFPKFLWLTLALLPALQGAQISPTITITFVGLNGEAQATFDDLGSDTTIGTIKDRLALTTDRTVHYLRHLRYGIIEAEDHETLADIDHMLKKTPFVSTIKKNMDVVWEDDGMLLLHVKSIQGSSPLTLGSLRSSDTVDDLKQAINRERKGKERVGDLVGNKKRLNDDTTTLEAAGITSGIIIYTVAPTPPTEPHAPSAPPATASNAPASPFEIKICIFQGGEERTIIPVLLQGQTQQGLTMNSTVADLKQEIAKRIGIPAAKQVITCTAEQLDDNESLRTYQITSDVRMHVTDTRAATLPRSNQRTPPSITPGGDEQVLQVRVRQEIKSIPMSQTDLTWDSTVAALKNKIHEGHSVEIEKLMYRGQKLEDANTLASYEIGPESIIQLVVPRKTQTSIPVSRSQDPSRQQALHPTTEEGNVQLVKVAFVVVGVAVTAYALKTLWWDRRKGGTTDTPQEEDTVTEAQEEEA